MPNQKIIEDESRDIQSTLNELSKFTIKEALDDPEVVINLFKKLDQHKKAILPASCLF